MDLKIKTGRHGEGVQHFMRAASRDISVRTLYLCPSFFDKHHPYLPPFWFAENWAIWGGEYRNIVINENFCEHAFEVDNNFVNAKSIDLEIIIKDVFNFRGHCS